MSVCGDGHVTRGEKPQAPSHLLESGRIPDLDMGRQGPQGPRPPDLPERLELMSTTSRLSELFLGEDNVRSGRQRDGRVRTLPQRTGITREPGSTLTTVRAGLQVFQT